MGLPSPLAFFELEKFTETDSMKRLKSPGEVGKKDKKSDYWGRVQRDISFFFNIAQKGEKMHRRR